MVRSSLIASWDNLSVYIRIRGPRIIPATPNSGIPPSIPIKITSGLEFEFLDIILLLSIASIPKLSTRPIIIMLTMVE